MPNTLNLDKKRVSKNIANILQYLKTSNDLSSAEIGKILGCSRYKVARIIKGTTDIDAFEWWALCKHFAIDNNAFIEGKIRTDANDDFYAFKVNDLYAADPYSSGTIIDMHIKSFKSCTSDLKFKEFCKAEKIDPTYFVNLNNSLNINYNLRLILNLVMNGFFPNEESIREYAQHSISVLDKSLMGSSIHLSKGVDRIFTYFQNSEKYETNHEYVVFDYKPNQGITFGYRPREHVDLNLYKSPFLSNFNCKFAYHFFFELANVPHLTAKKVSCIHQGDSFCSYHYVNSLYGVS